MDINDPEVVREVTDAFWHYEQALTSNDVEALIQLFWASPHTLRFGHAETLYGHAAIEEFRRSRDGVGPARVITRLVVTTFGRDLGTANCEAQNRRTGAMSRQSHTWVRLPNGWRIVAAHVSAKPT